MESSATNHIARLIVTFGLPLLVAIVIRFAIKRRPLSDLKACLVAVILWFCTYLALDAFIVALPPLVPIFIAAVIAYSVLRIEDGRTTDEAETIYRETRVRETRVKSASIPWHLLQSHWPNVRIAFGVVIALMFLFPPWTSEQLLSARGITSTRPAGYAFIGAPPDPPNRGTSIRLDLSRLLVQIGAVASIWAVGEGLRVLRRD